MPRELKCEMVKGCACTVSMLDNKGYIYCALHGSQRRLSGTPCRKLTKAEVKRLERGEALTRY